jgi:hypothetical protein
MWRKYLLAIWLLRQIASKDFAGYRYGGNWVISTGGTYTR